MGACMERSLPAGVCISLPPPTQLAEEDIASQSITASSKLLYSDRLCSLVCSHEAMHPAPMGMSQEGKKDGAGGEAEWRRGEQKRRGEGLPFAFYDLSRDSSISGPFQMLPSQPALGMRRRVSDKKTVSHGLVQGSK